MNEIVERQRGAVIKAAVSWLGTPYHDMGRVKGVGVDCAQLLAAVYEEAGIIEHTDTGYYSPQHFFHSDCEKLEPYVGRYAKQIDEDRALPGDVVLYKIHRVYAHAAIVVDWPREIIHAHKQSGKVVAMPPFEYDLQRFRVVRFYSFWG